MLTGVHSALEESAPVATLDVSPPLDGVDDEPVDDEPVDDEPVLDDDEQPASPAVRTAAANTASKRLERDIQSLSFWE
jgi:hypothetical protein